MSKIICYEIWRNGETVTFREHGLKVLGRAVSCLESAEFARQPSRKYSGGGDSCTHAHLFGTPYISEPLPPNFLFSLVGLG